MNKGTNSIAIYRPRVELAALAALFVAVFLPVVPGLVQDWNNRPDASQGWIVLPLALWLAWGRREAVRREPAGIFMPAIGIVAFGLLAAVVSFRAGLESVGRLGLVTTLNGLLLYHLGWARYRWIAFPALFLFLMIPVPITITGAVTFPLQLFATQASELTIGLIGIPVERMGNILRLPAGSLEVVEACSGLRSAMTFVTLGALTAWMTPGIVRKIAVVALAIPCALLANIIRITATGALLQLFGPTAIEGLAHDALGLVSFLIGLGVYAAAAKALGSQWMAR